VSPHKSKTPEIEYRRGPHWLAWALACATFALIWAGGLVATYGAAMAIPDWPNTYGYNMLLYPPERWLGVWDVFLKQTHRLIAVSVGTLTIALAVVLWRTDSRKWVRWLGVGAAVGVSLQAVLGGLRVLGDEILLAKIHGCTAPLFFTLSVTLVALTSPRWFDSAAAAGSDRVRHLQRWALFATACVYLQIVLGAQLRHVGPAEPVGWFKLWVWLHVIVAGFGLAAVLWLVVAATRRADRPTIARRTRLLAVVFVVQLVLGAATWVTNYGWPKWFTDNVWAPHYTVVADGPLQAITTTAHVAFGALSLALAWSATLGAYRLSPTRPTKRA